MPLSAAGALGALLDQRAVGRTAVSAHEAAETIRWLGTVPCWEASLDDAKQLAHELSRLCASLAGQTGE